MARAHLEKLALLIEDDRDLAETLTEFLGLLGYRAVGLSDPASVDDMHFDPQPDLIVMDIMLKSMSGIEVAAQFREAGYLSPILAVSASPLMLQEARDSGLFADVLEKPFDLIDLQRCVEPLIKQLSAEAEGDSSRWSE